MTQEQKDQIIEWVQLYLSEWENSECIEQGDPNDAVELMCNIADLINPIR